MHSKVAKGNFGKDLNVIEYVINVIEYVISVIEYVMMEV